MPIWLGHDEVIQLREWSSGRVYELPAAGVAECPVGAEPSSEGIQLDDPKGYVSRWHARLVRDGAFWVLANAQSKNGITEGRVLREKILLVPGVEVGIGSLTLVAENRMLVDLRAYLARVIGWEVASPPVVAFAIRAIRDAAHARAPLVIGGAKDVVAVARQIHLRTTGPGAPFVVCGPRPHQSDISLRVTASLADATAAYDRAAGGTVCVRADEPPNRYDHLVQLTSERRAPAQLMVCSESSTARSLTVPELDARPPGELHRIVAEYAADSIRELGAAPTSFTEQNHAWVMANEATSFAELEVATLRLVALNDAHKVHAAAARLGVHHGGLGRWFGRHRIKR